MIFTKEMGVKKNSDVKEILYSSFSIDFRDDQYIDNCLNKVMTKGKCKKFKIMKSIPMQCLIVNKSLHQLKPSRCVAACFKYPKDNASAPH